MQIDLLGPLRVRTPDGAEIPVPGARLRRLLAELALRAPHPVSTTLLEDLLWTDDVPSGPGALQSLVSRLRRTLGPGVGVTAGPAGYALHGVQVDVPAVEAGFARGRTLVRDGSWDAADDALTTALDRWAGPLTEIAGTPDAVRLEEARLDALADRAQARLQTRRLDGLAAELTELLDAHPLRERFAELLVRVLVAAGRTGEALAAFEHTRRVLADELGADPSAGLRDAHRAALVDPVAAPERVLPVPQALTSFVGRDGDVQRVTALLASGRCVTVVGPGGAGKTRLSTEISQGVGEVVHFVPLAPVAEGGDLLGAVAAAVGARDTGLELRGTRPEQDQRSRVVSALRGRRTLLVLDNCEHVVDDVAHLVEDLLHACPELTVLATSREALGVEGEVLHPLGPLRGESAVRLFVDRAAAVSPGFAVTRENSAVVDAVVTRLDGLPLALELAAARLRTMSVDDLLDRLDDRFRVLTGGRRTAVARHRTLRAVVDWSWDLLGSEERTLLQRLSVFHAPVSVEAAAALAPDLGDELTVADLLGSLTEKSLLQLRPVHPARYAVLETIKEYGSERLAASGEAQGVLEARTTWALTVSERASRGLRSAEQLAWSLRLDAESEDLLAALRHLVATGRGAQALHLATPLAMWWTALGRHSQVREWVGLARSAGGGGTADLVAESLEIVNGLMDGQAEVDRATARMEELHAELGAVPVAERSAMTVLLSMFLGRFTTEVPEGIDRLGDDPRMADFLASAGADPFLRALVEVMCAAAAENIGDIATMVDCARRAERGFAAVGESLGRAGALRLVGQGLLYEGDLDRAEVVYREAGDLVGAFGNADDEIQMRMRLVDVLQRRGRFDLAHVEIERMEVVAAVTSATTRSWLVLTQVGLLRADGRVEQARGLIQEQMDLLLARAAGGVWGHERATLQTAKALVLVDAGDTSAAAALLGETLDLSIDTHDMPIVALTAVAVARWALATGELLRSARVLGIAAALRGADDPTDPEVSRLRTALDERGAPAEVDRAYAAGKALPRPAALVELRAMFAGPGAQKEDRGTP